MSACPSPSDAFQGIFWGDIHVSHIFNSSVHPSFLWSSVQSLAISLETHGGLHYRIFVTVHDMAVPLELSFHHLGRDWSDTLPLLYNFVHGVVKSHQLKTPTKHLHFHDVGSFLVLHCRRPAFRSIQGDWVGYGLVNLRLEA